METRDDVEGIGFAPTVGRLLSHSASGRARCTLSGLGIASNQELSINGVSVAARCPGADFVGDSPTRREAR